MYSSVTLLISCSWAAAKNTQAITYPEGRHDWTSRPCEQSFRITRKKNSDENLSNFPMWLARFLTDLFDSSARDIFRLEDIIIWSEQWWLAEYTKNQEPHRLELQCRTPKPDRQMLMLLLWDWPSQWLNCCAYIFDEGIRNLPISSPSKMYSGPRTARISFAECESYNADCENWSYILGNTFPLEKENSQIRQVLADITQQACIQQACYSLVRCGICDQIEPGTWFNCRRSSDSFFIFS